MNKQQQVTNKKTIKNKPICQCAHCSGNPRHSKVMHVNSSTEESESESDYEFDSDCKPIFDDKQILETLLEDRKYQFLLTILDSDSSPGANIEALTSFHTRLGKDVIFWSYYRGYKDTLFDYKPLECMSCGKVDARESIYVESSNGSHVYECSHCRKKDSNLVCCSSCSSLEQLCYLYYDLQQDNCDPDNLRCLFCNLVSRELYELAIFAHIYKYRWVNTFC